MRPLARGHTAGLNPGLSNPPKSVLNQDAQVPFKMPFTETGIAFENQRGENQTNQTRNRTFFKPLLQALMGPETNGAWAGFPGRGTVCTLGGVFLRGAWPSPHPVHAGPCPLKTSCVPQSCVIQTPIPPRGFPY